MQEIKDLIQNYVYVDLDKNIQSYDEVFVTDFCLNYLSKKYEITEIYNYNLVDIKKIITTYYAVDKNIDYSEERAWYNDGYDDNDDNDDTTDLRDLTFREVCKSLDCLGREILEKQGLGVDENGNLDIDYALSHPIIPENMLYILHRLKSVHNLNTFTYNDFIDIKLNIKKYPNRYIDKVARNFVNNKFENEYSVETVKLIRELLNDLFVDMGSVIRPEPIKRKDENLILSKFVISDNEDHSDSYVLKSLSEDKFNGNIKDELEKFCTSLVKSFNIMLMLERKDKLIKDELLCKFSNDQEINKYIVEDYILVDNYKSIRKKMSDECLKRFFERSAPIIIRNYYKQNFDKILTIFVLMYIAKDGVEKISFGERNVIKYLYKKIDATSPFDDLLTYSKALVYKIKQGQKDFLSRL